MLSDVYMFSWFQTWVHPLCDSCDNEWVQVVLALWPLEMVIRRNHIKIQGHKSSRLAAVSIRFRLRSFFYMITRRWQVFETLMLQLQSTSDMDVRCMFAQQLGLLLCFWRSPCWWRKIGGKRSFKMNSFRDEKVWKGSVLRKKLWKQVSFYLVLEKTLVYYCNQFLDWTLSPSWLITGPWFFW